MLNAEKRATIREHAKIQPCNLNLSAMCDILNINNIEITEFIKYLKLFTDQIVQCLDTAL